MSMHFFIGYILYKKKKYNRKARQKQKCKEKNKDKSSVALGTRPQLKYAKFTIVMCKKKRMGSITRRTMV